MGVAEELENRLRPLAEASGLDVVDVEYRPEGSGWVLRVYLDKPGGFGLSDCEEWSRRIGDLVEESGVIPQRYSLEVSSPGLRRPLKSAADFQRFTGIDAEVRTLAPVGNQRNFHGRIEAVEGEDLVLLDRTSGRVRIPLKGIASARLDPPVTLD